MKSYYFLIDSDGLSCIKRNLRIRIGFYIALVIIKRNF